THMKKKIKPKIFRKKTNTPMIVIQFSDRPNSYINGKLYPPKYRAAISADETNILIYSENIYRPSFIDEYSVWYPPISSVSHSGRSKGTRLHSANAHTIKIKKPIGCAQIFQLTKPDCCATISPIDKAPVTINEPMLERTIGTSSLILCDAARTAPINENVLFNAQPPSIIPYTPSATTPKTYNTPTLISATCKTTSRPPIFSV